MRSIVEEAVPAWFVNANDSEISVLDCTPSCPKIDRQFFFCYAARIRVAFLWISFGCRFLFCRRQILIEIAVLN